MVIKIGGVLNKMHGIDPALKRCDSSSRLFRRMRGMNGAQVINTSWPDPSKRLINKSGEFASAARKSLDRGLAISIALPLKRSEKRIVMTSNRRLYCGFAAF
jgi:hypothetical protein